MQISEELVRTVVRKVLAERSEAVPEAAAAPAPIPAAPPAVPRQVDPSGILRARTGDVPLEPFQGRADVRLRDIAALEEAPRIGCGVMELDGGADLEWTLTYDEWDVILKGRLEIRIDGRTIAGEPGDVLYIPRGSRIHFTAPEPVRFVYTVYPADW